MSGNEFAIVVNGELAVVPHQEVSYEEVVAIAFPIPPTPANPAVTYSVTFNHAASTPYEGFLVRGGLVTANRTGTEFDVSPTGKS